MRIFVTGATGFNRGFDEYEARTIMAYVHETNVNSRKRCAPSPFASLRNIGKAGRADLAVLGVVSMEQLAACDPDQLYAALQMKTARQHDPCVWDVFAAAIHQARTGEPRDWWTFTPARKLRQALGRFNFERPPRYGRAGTTTPQSSSP